MIPKKDRPIKNAPMLVLIVLLAITALPAESDLTRLLPNLDGWERQGPVEFYRPENLFEYINGAAENFLIYDFQELVVQTYRQGSDIILAVEIYRHLDPDAAFGIYSSEKPLAGNFLSIGAQGYSEEEILNFWSGNYYVKISGYGLGVQREKILNTAAQQISELIGGGKTMPALLTAFPDKGKVQNSERYIRKNFLGHSFLYSAFVADYQAEGGKFQLFIITTANTAAARDLILRYKALAKEKEPALSEARTVVQDPYNGAVTLAWRDSLVWGLVGKADTNDYIGLIAKKLFPDK